jgi:uncharacterized protein
MKRVRVENRTRDRLLGDRIAVADGIWTRLRGLLGRPEPEEGEGLLIVPCGGVHMYGMRYPLDVLLLDRERRVVALYPGLAPGKRTRMHRGARFALELRAGQIERTGTREADMLEWVPTERGNADRNGS